jgi:hypothetical protein
MANRTASTSSPTCRVAQPTHQLEPRSVSPTPRPATPFPTTPTLASTSFGSPRHGLRLTGNEPHFTWKPTPFNILWDLAKCRFWALSSPFSLYASSDHLPLKWIRKCEKVPVSEFTIEQLSDIQWVHSYIPGPENSLFDALSRNPLLGTRVLAPIGLSDAVSTLLDAFPDSLRDAHATRIFAPPHTQKVAQQVQAWRRPTNPIDVHSVPRM